MLPTCDKFGRAVMVEAANKGEIKEVNVWVEEKRWIFMCPTLWTPFNDQIQENTFESLVLGNIRNDLAWGARQPNGDTTENRVRIMTATKLLEDVN